MDKLKKQIKEAKEAKKQQKKEAKKTVGLFDGAEVSSKETTRAAGKAAAAAAGGDLEEFLVVKKAAERPNIQTDSASAAVEDDSSQGNLLLLLPPDSSKQSKKSKKLKISIDGEGKDGGDQRKKIIFDEDGSTLADARDGLAALFKSASGRLNEFGIVFFSRLYVCMYVCIMHLQMSSTCFHFHNAVERRMERSLKGRSVLKSMPRG